MYRQLRNCLCIKIVLAMCQMLGKFLTFNIDLCLDLGYIHFDLMLGYTWNCSWKSQLIFLPRHYHTIDPESCKQENVT